MMILPSMPALAPPPPNITSSCRPCGVESARRLPSRFGGEDEQPEFVFKDGPNERCSPFNNVVVMLSMHTPMKLSAEKKTEYIHVVFIGRLEPRRLFSELHHLSDAYRLQMSRK